MLPAFWRLNEAWLPIYFFRENEYSTRWLHTYENEMESRESKTQKKADVIFQYNWITNIITQFFIYFLLVYFQTGLWINQYWPVIWIYQCTHVRRTYGWLWRSLSTMSIFGLQSFKSGRNNECNRKYYLIWHATSLSKLHTPFSNYVPLPHLSQQKSNYLHYLYQYQNFL